MAYTVIRSIAVCIACLSAGMNLLHLLQEKRYRVHAVAFRLKWNDAQVWRHILITVGAVVADVVLPVLTSSMIQKEALRTEVCRWGVLALFCIAAAFSFWTERDTDTENDFVLTKRTARLIAAELLITIVCILILNVLGLPNYILFAAATFIVPIAAVIMRPVEDFLNARYFKAAQKKLAERRDLVSVGIVGSCGKTEVKIILKTLLSEKFRVLATPPAFSSAVGIARTVNEQLQPQHQVFIAEMGAVQKGEIAEMARMVRPKYGIVTCISANKTGPFHSVEAIAQSMNELLSRLRKNGLAVFGSDGSYSDRLYALYKGNKRNAGALSGRKCYMQAHNIEVSPRGTRFELVCEDGSHIWMDTVLLGMYSIRNIAVAAAIASDMGMTMEEIAAGVKKLKPFRHHLQLRPGRIHVIDDSANHDSEAAVEALKVLAEFPGRRILVVRGFDSEDAGYSFGTAVPGRADHVLLVGYKRTRDISAALQDSDFPSAALHTVKSEAEAIAFLEKLAADGDTILYEGIMPGAEDD